MQLMYEIPDSFWSLFRSVNRAAYMEALLILNEEYQYNNYFLSRDVCIQILGDFYAKKRVALAREDNENDQEASEPPASRILNWLIRTGWLRRQEDYERPSSGSLRRTAARPTSIFRTFMPRFFPFAQRPRPTKAC